MIPIIISQPDRRQVKVKQAGIVQLGPVIWLNDVLYTPTFKCNLISTQKLAQDENYIVSYRPDFCVIQDLTSKMLIGAGDPGNGVYYLRRMNDGLAFSTTKKVDLVKWHKHLGRPSHDSLASLSVNCGFKLN